MAFRDSFEMDGVAFITIFDTPTAPLYLLLKAKVMNLIKAARLGGIS